MVIMVPTHSAFFRSPLLVRFLVRFSSINSSTSLLHEFDMKPKLNNVEQEKILSVLNQPSTNNLLNLNVSQTKIKNLESYKKKNGPFKSLNELLEVDGLSVKLLEKLCRQIISEAPSTNFPKCNKGNNNKKLKQFLAPSLPTEIKISSSVGIHLAPMGVSWAKMLHSGNYLDCWGYQDFTSLPKKMLPTDTFRLAVDILNKLPFGDIYVLEGSSNMGLQGQKQSSALTSYTQHLELSSMLLALINTSSKHTTKTHETDNSDDPFVNKVYFLRSKLPARLFKTLVGNECVSSTSTVLQLLDSSLTQEFQLPCSPISVDHKLKTDFLSLPSTNKELLGQALMLAVTFINLCVTRNLISINAVAPRKK